MGFERSSKFKKLEMGYLPTTNQKDFCLLVAWVSIIISGTQYAGYTENAVALGPCMRV